VGKVIQLSDRLDLDTPWPKNPLHVYLDRLAPGSRYMAQEFSGGTRTEETFRWADLRYEQTSAMRASLAKRYAPATANKMLSALRGILTECWRLGQMDVESLARAKDIEPVTGKRTPKGRALSQNEVDMLLWHTGNARHAELVRFMLATGLRRSEASALRWEDIREGIITVKGKGNKERQVPIPGKLLLHIGGKWQGPITGRIFKVSPGRIWHILRQAAFEAGIPPLSPHDLRRTYATRLLGSGVDLATVQRLMGHSSPTTTAGYDKRGVDDAAAAVEKVWGSV
jgi:integrase